MARYAQGTTVSVSKSKAEIEEAFERFGVSDYLSGFRMDGRVYQVDFTYKGREYHTTVTLPKEDRAEARRLMRTLLLNIKAKLAAAEDGIFGFEHEWLADTVILRDKETGEARTVRDVIEPQLQMLTTGRGPTRPRTLLLPAPTITVLSSTENEGEEQTP